MGLEEAVKEVLTDPELVQGPPEQVLATTDRDLVDPPVSEYSDTDEDSNMESSLAVPWVSIIRRLGINILVPFVNGVMLGFGEILAHEIGLLWGWRTAKVYDPTSLPPATNPRARRKWLFGLI